MLEKEVRKLRKRQLVQIVMEQDRAMAELQQQLELANQKLADRKIVMEESGSIAEAALQINGVFEAANAAAQQYIENIQRMEAETQEKCEKMEREVTEKCEEMKAEAERGVEARWIELSSRLDRFFEEHQDLQKLINATKGE